MNRFILPVTIAAAVHGLVLGIPRVPAEPEPTTEKLETIADRFVPVLPLVPPEKADVVDVAPPGGSPIERPGIDEPPTIPGPKDIVIPVTIVPTPSGIGPVNVIPSGPYAPGGPGIGGIHGDIVSAKYLDHAPTTRVMIAPTYPPNARRDLLEGEVSVEFTVDEAGNVHDARVVSSTDPVFNTAAVTAVAKWRFAPGTRSGIPVRFRMALPLVFRLDR